MSEPSSHTMEYKTTPPCLVLLLLVTLNLLPLTAAQSPPYQCVELTQIISCGCGGKMVDGVPDISHVVLTCNNLALSKVPPILGNSNHVVYELTLANNNIQTLPAAAFNGLRIERLDLRGNRLTSINVSAFHGLESDLKELYIGSENGSSVEPPIASLTNLTALDTLYLEHFKFTNNELETNSRLHSLTNLESLTLTSNHLSYIAPGSLPINLISLTIDRQDLSSYPADSIMPMPQLTSLTFTNTKIPRLTRQVFKSNDRLQHLDLGFNNIRTIAVDSFEGITTSLRSLSLNNNPITNVSDLNEVKQLRGLTSLQLSHMQLTELPANAQFLLNKSSLISLHLESNSLRSLGAEVFKEVGGNLKELSLARNQLAAMHDQALAGLTALTSLDLSHQTIGTPLRLPPSLTSLTALKTLKMSGTHVAQDVLWERVSDMTSLTTLNLDDMSLTSIQDFALMNLTQLEELNLDNNQLSEVTQTMLAGPRNLRLLSLNNNNIPTLSRCVFYGFSLSPPLKLYLVNPLDCNCNLRWLLEERKAGRINLSQAEQCSSPADKNNTYLFQYSPADFTCLGSSQPNPTCIELYTTPQPPTTVTTPSPNIRLTITNVTSSSITVQWTVTDYPDLQYFKVRHMDLETSKIELSERIGTTARTQVVEGLAAKTAYSVCVQGYDSNNDIKRHCDSTTTLAGSADNQGQGGEDDDGGSSDTGLIVGVVIGVIVILAVIAAILYIVLLRKRGPKKDIPVQAHTFTPSELPGMSAQTRQFTKPKQPPKVGRALDESIKVTVISDGHTGAASPRDRQSAGSYQFLDEKHPNPNPGVTPSGGKSYVDDVEDRPLPSAPQDSMKGYYNNGFQKEKDSQHTYNQIEHNV